MNFSIELKFNVVYNRGRKEVILMKETVSNRLKQIMSERGLKQVDILRLSKPIQEEIGIKLSKSTLSQYVNGIQSPDQDRYYLLSKTLNVSEPWLMGFDVQKERVPDEERKSLKDLSDLFIQLVPDRQNKVFNFAETQLNEQNNVIEFPDRAKELIRGRRMAGGSALHVDDTDARKEVVSSALIPKGADELVEVVGKSMEPLIKDGEEVYIRYQPTVENGEIAVVRIENEGVTCKRVYVEENSIRLKAENPEYEDMHFDPSQITVLGKVLL